MVRGGRNDPRWARRWQARRRRDKVRGFVPRSRLYLETFLLSLGVLLLEVSYTRVFSYKLVYYFSYLLIGLALLGLGAGSILVAVSARLTRAPISRLIAAGGLAGSLSAFVGYLVVALTPLNLMGLATALWTRGVPIPLLGLAKLTGLCLAVFAPFLIAGVLLAAIFSAHPDRINRLYGADLLGAALGCAICVPLMVTLSPPGTIMLGGLCFAGAGLWAARHDGRVMLVPLAATGLLLAGASLFAARLPDPIPDRFKLGTVQRQFWAWHPVFRVDVIATPDPAVLWLVHDGLLGAAMRRWNGDAATLPSYEKDGRSYPFRILGPRPRVAIVGAAGGNEILASLAFDAAHVTAIELNPVTYSLLTQRLADFGGHLAEHPRVSLVNAEGRSFLRASNDRYDLVWFVAPDSYAAMNAATSGAFVLSESYLYTVEMVQDSLAHLTTTGIICAQFGDPDFAKSPNRTLRYLVTAGTALRSLGVEDVGRHLLVASAGGFGSMRSSTILVKPTPFTREEVTRFVETAGRLEGAQVHHAWTLPASDGPIADAVSLRGAALDQWLRKYPFAVSAVTDDVPFFWHFARFGDVLRHWRAPRGQSVEEGIGERLLLVLLALATALGASLLALPLLRLGGVWRTIPHKGHAAVYFATLGLGFMLVEVTLIQRLTLFLGYPTYALTVTLFALLLSTGAGSVLSERLSPVRTTFVALAATLLVLVALCHQGMPPILARWVGAPFIVRVLLTVTLLTPLGLCLGAFMPLGLRWAASVTPHAQAFVAWCWAINGFCSVVASVLATVLSMTFGFGRVLLAGAGVYLIGIAVLAGVAPPGALRGRRGG